MLQNVSIGTVKDTNSYCPTLAIYRQLNFMDSQGKDAPPDVDLEPEINLGDCLANGCLMSFWYELLL